MAKGDNVRPGPGQDIRKYSVDQLLDVRAEDAAAGNNVQQMDREIERRARLHDKTEESSR